MTAKKRAQDLLSQLEELCQDVKPGKRTHTALHNACEAARRIVEDIASLEILTQARIVQNRGLKIGDIVKLNSGGPDMTVTITEHGKVGACWFQTDTELGSYAPPVSSLVIPEAALTLVRLNPNTVN